MNDIVMVSQRSDFTYRPELRINGTRVEYFDAVFRYQDGAQVLELQIPVKSMVTISPQDGELMTSVRSALSLDT